MLVDITTNYDGRLRRIERGLYLLLDAMAPYELLRETTEWMEFSYEWPELQGDGDSRLKTFLAWCEAGTWFNEYGSCDSPAQFLRHEYGRLAEASPHAFVVTFHHMPREDYAGYRWHKNGPYIGEREKQYEHLGDETNITEIYQFHVWRRRTPPPAVEEERRVRPEELVELLTAGLPPR